MLCSALDAPIMFSSWFIFGYWKKENFFIRTLIAIVLEISEASCYFIFPLTLDYERRVYTFIRIFVQPEDSLTNLHRNNMKLRI